MWIWFITWLKWAIAGKELEKLERYRLTCQEVQRWNASLPQSARTAEYIYETGEGHEAKEIGRFREEIRHLGRQLSKSELKGYSGNATTD